MSGQELCEHLGVSRTAVWKNIRQLQEEGYEIQAVKNKGYRLLAAPDVVLQEEVHSQLHTEWIGHRICYREEVDSTNTLAKQLAEEGAGAGTLVLAEKQSMGKGRRGRSWVNPPGTNIAMTLLLRPDIPPEKASMLTLVMGLAVARGCNQLLGVEAKIKWPNDVILSGKKICGILTEMSAQVDYINYLVIGTGINVNLEEIPEEIRDKATSLYLETGVRVSRGKLIAAVLEAFEPCYEQFLRTQDLSGMLAEYNRLLVNCGRPVTVLDPGGAYEGVSRGINSQGELLVVREDQTETAVYAGEVSVRGIYGYV